MSVPVVGTIMALCIAYILPSTDSSWMPAQLRDFQPSPAPPPEAPLRLSLSPRAVPDPGARDRLLPEAEGEKRDSGHLLEVQEDHAVRLKVSMGLAGIRITPEDPEPFYCHYCTGIFKHWDPVFEWKSVTGELLLLHERCILSFSEEMEANSVTLCRVQELADNTRSMGCLHSLFACEDDLVRLNVWPLDEPTPSSEPKSPDGSESAPEPEPERPCKARRTLFEEESAS